MKTINNIGRQAEGHTLYVEIVINDDGTYTLADVQPWAIANQTVLVPWQKDGGAVFYAEAVPDGDDDIVIEFIYEGRHLGGDGFIARSEYLDVEIIVTLDAGATEIKYVFASTIDGDTFDTIDVDTLADKEGEE